jgi:hypothetical protein
MKTIAKALTTVFCIASILFSAWFVLSWIDIVADNCEPNPVHSEYNLFVMMVENAEKN